MEFLSRIYDRLFPRYKCFLVLGASGGRPLWHWKSWRTILPKLSGFAAELGVKPSVHCRQGIRGRNANAPLGRLPWSELGHQRWCHDSPVTEGSYREWVFEDAEVFLPSRATLIKTRGFPVAYLQIASTLPEAAGRTAYDQEVLFVVRLVEFRRHEPSARALVSGLQSAAGGVLTLSEVRRVVSLNQFEDIRLEDFSYVGMLEDPLPDLSRLRGRWQTEPSGGRDAEQTVAADEAQRL